MKRFISILFILLLVQITIFAVLALTKNKKYTLEEELPLLSFTDHKKVNTFKISDGNDDLTLTLNNGQWTIPDFQNFPADNDKVSKFLDDIAGLKKGWPVANSSSGAIRYGVGNENFEKQVDFIADNRWHATLLLGDSPTFKKVYARNSSNPKTYIVNYNAYEASLKPSYWYDNQIFYIDQNEVEEITYGNIKIYREEKSWKLDGITDEQSINDSKINNFIKAALSLNFDEVISKDQRDELADKKKSSDTNFKLKIVKSNGEKITYEFWPVEGTVESATQFYIRKLDYKHILKSRKFNFRDILETRREDLIHKVDPAINEKEQ